MTDLVLATNDRDLLAASFCIKAPVFRMSRVGDAALFARSIRAELAIGPDVLDQAAGLNFPFAVLYADRDFLNLAALANLHTLGIYELPLEIDWLHDRLGFYESAQKNN
jgi:hypothetical protein